MADIISRAALLDEFRSLCGPQTGDGDNECVLIVGHSPRQTSRGMRAHGMTDRTCATCRHDLGGGYNNCRINLERECAAGWYEAWEAKDEADGKATNGGKNKEATKQ